MRALVTHQCGPGLIPQVGRHVWVEFVVGLLLAPRGFSPGTPVFPSPQKFLNSSSIDLESEDQRIISCNRLLVSPPSLNKVDLLTLFYS